MIMHWGHKFILKKEMIQLFKQLACVIPGDEPVLLWSHFINEISSIKSTHKIPQIFVLKQSSHLP